MNDSPGWSSPGSSPSDGERPGASDPSAPQQQPPADSRWSAQQPPPGQWGNPGQGGAHAPGAPQQPQQPQQQQPGAGWGSYGGQSGYGQYGGGPGGWGYPPAAKPGVIPLRPLGLGEILDGAVTTMRTHWRSVLPITLVVAAVVQLVNVLVQKYAANALENAPEPGADPSEVFEALGSSAALSIASGFVQAIGALLVTALLTMVFSRAVLGQKSTVAGAWRDARGQLLRLAGLTLLLAVGALLLIVVLILPGILAQSPGLAVLGAFGAIALIVWLWIKFSLASPALMLERAKVFTSLQRSSKLVKGSWWRIFGITLLTALITGLVSGIIVAPAMFLAIAVDGGMQSLAEGTVGGSWTFLIITGIASVLALTVTMPITAGVTVLLYVDQRIRREALDLELARAAGIENYGSTHDTTYGGGYGQSLPPTGPTPGV
ncbi:hypothetical protein [Streptomyces bambusae]|uniref:Glycerophosphoryl diester phosphodiesterase membrane domain-containing protein n=1 Tax=Streptomyces bambusae TaxID=1550616 RepID=A0ABS6ZFX0_9ACTN|nr:hypothetical protein [Streptomyces bambusae]MBW5486647.1 hypothetical protein [Streptomyces bambusae]